MIADGGLARSLRGLRTGRRGRRTGARGLASGTRARGRPGTRRRLRATWRLWLLVACVTAGALLGGGWLWLRHSTLVTVERVTITGVTGPDADQIRASLEAAARGMTTLDVRLGTLRAAISPYPVVAGLRVATEFPHGLRIAVLERLPVAAARIGGQAVPVSADGTLLRDVPGDARLPVLGLRAVPGGTRIAEAGALAQLRVLAAAPGGIRDRIAGADSGYWHGVILQLRQGPSVYFGSDTDAAAKWRAVLALLATPADAGASYLDVTDPTRPAAGVGGTEASLANAVGASLSGTAATATATTGG